MTKDLIYILISGDWDLDDKADLSYSAIEIVKPRTQVKCGDCGINNNNNTGNLYPAYTFRL